MDESVPREPLAAHWASKRKRAQDMERIECLVNLRKGLPGDPEKQGKGLGQLILEWGTLSRKGREA